MRLLTVFLVGLYFFASGEAAEVYQPMHPDPLSESWRWKTFPELKGKGLSCLAETPDGALWFGIDQGVLRYDEIRWFTYTSEDGIYGVPIRSLCVTRDGMVYAGSEHGISRFQNGVWKRVFLVRDLHAWPIYDLAAARDGSIWAATGWGALRVTQTDTMLYTSQDMVAAVAAIAPDLAVVVVPIPVHPWSEGIGVAVVYGDERFRRGHIPWTVCGLAPDGPGVVAELKLGDRIVGINGQSLPGDLDCGFGARGCSFGSGAQPRVDLSKLTFSL